MRASKESNSGGWKSYKVEEREEAKGCLYLLQFLIIVCALAAVACLIKASI